MLKYTLVILTLFTATQSLAASRVLTEECLQRVAAQGPVVKESAIAVIKGQRISEIKRKQQVPVDVQVFNDAHDLLAALPHLAEPEVLEERQLMVLAAICESPSFEAEEMGTILESLEVPF